MKSQDIAKFMASMEPAEDVICVWFSKDDFPVGLTDDGYETLSTEDWSRVVSRFEDTKWDNPLDSSWENVHRDIYKLVGEKVNASV